MRDLETFCRCGHGFEEHADVQVRHRAGERDTRCQVAGCSCAGYRPGHGTQPIPVVSVPRDQIKQRAARHRAVWVDPKDVA